MDSVTKNILLKLHKSSDLKACVQLITDITFLIAGIFVTLSSDRAFIVLLGTILTGSRMYSLLDGTGHQLAHNNLFETKRMNQYCGRIVYMIIFRSFDGYRESHFTHHRCLLDPKCDYTYNLYRRAGLYEDNPPIFFIYFIKPLLGFATLLLLEDMWSELKKDSKFRNQALPLIILILAAVSFNSYFIPFFFAWILPRFYWTPIFDYWSEIAEHFNAIQGGSRDFLGGIGTLLLDWYGEGHHYLHHKYPGIPSYNLRVANRILGPAPDTAQGVFDLYTQLKMKEAVIERVDSREEFGIKYSEKIAPVHFKKALKEFPLLDWKTKSLLKLVRGITVKATSRNIEQGVTRLCSVSLAEYIESLESNSQADSPMDFPYVSQVNLFELVPSLKSSLNFFAELLGRSPKRLFPYVWIGREGTVTGLHRDDSDNLFAQVKGRKKFWLIPPEFSSRVYISRKYDYGATLSEVDLHHLDLDIYPRMKNVPILFVDVEEGDILFIPKGWWHQVESLSVSVSISCFTQTWLEYLFTLPGEVIFLLHKAGLVAHSHGCTCHPYPIVILDSRNQNK